MKRVILLLVACICMAFSCVHKEDENHHWIVKVTNSADYPVYVTYSWVGLSHIPEESLEYPWYPEINKGGEWPFEDRESKFGKNQYICHKGTAK